MTEIEQQLSKMNAELSRISAANKREAERLGLEEHVRKDAEDIALRLVWGGKSRSEAHAIATEAAKSLNRYSDGTPVDLAGDLRTFLAARSSGSGATSVAKAREPATERERIRAREADEIKAALREAGVPKARRDRAVEEIFATARSWAGGGTIGLNVEIGGWLKKYEGEREVERASEAHPSRSDTEFALDVQKALGVVAPPASKKDQTFYDGVVGGHVDKQT